MELSWEMERKQLLERLLQAERRAALGIGVAAGITLCVLLGVLVILATAGPWMF